MLLNEKTSGISGKHQTYQYSHYKGSGEGRHKGTENLFKENFCNLGKETHPATQEKAKRESQIRSTEAHRHNQKVKNLKTES